MQKPFIDEMVTEGRNQALYVAHDHWQPDKAQFLYAIRKEIVKRLKSNAPHYPVLGVEWPKEYPDFEKYTYTPG